MTEETMLAIKNSEMEKISSAVDDKSRKQIRLGTDATAPLPEHDVFGRQMDTTRDLNRFIILTLPCCLLALGIVNLALLPALSFLIMIFFFAALAAGCFSIVMAPTCIFSGIVMLCIIASVVLTTEGVDSKKCDKITAGHSTPAICTDNEVKT